MFGIGKVSPGSYVFVAKRDENSNFIVIGKVTSENDKLYTVKGSFFRPVGLIQRIRSGRAQGNPTRALDNPDPNNCIFLLIDKVDVGNYEDIIDPKIDKIIRINENRYYVLDGWLKESLPELFSNYYSASNQEEKLEARDVLINKMNSLMSQELKEHLYAVIRSSGIL